MNQPTDEQRAVAAELLECEEVDIDFPYCDVHGGSWPCADMTRVARALAAAVQQERDKVLAVADELEREARQHAIDAVDNPGVSSEQAAEVGISVGKHEQCLDAARRIREVSR